MNPSERELSYVGETRSNADDEALIRRMCEADETALGALYDRWVRSLYSLVLHLLQDPDEAEDVVEETFWQAWKKASAYEPSKGAVSTWLLTIGRRKALDRIRAKLGIPGVSVTILFPDGSAWTGVSGFADVAARTKVTPATAFAFASVSKTFTSALIRQLSDEGRLRLTAPAASLLPPIRLKIDRRITVAMLLDHTSGPADYFLNPQVAGPPQAHPRAAWPGRRPRGGDRKAARRPGAAWRGDGCAGRSGGVRGVARSGRGRRASSSWTRTAGGRRRRS